MLKKFLKAVDEGYISVIPNCVKSGLAIFSPVLRGLFSERKMAPGTIVTSHGSNENKTNIEAYTIQKTQTSV